AGARRRRRREVCLRGGQGKASGRRGGRLDLLPAGVALADPVPVADAVLAQLPAQLDGLAVAVRREIDQAFERSLQRDAQAVERGDRLQPLELGSAGGVARLLALLLVLRRRSVASRFVLGDVRLVLELRQQSGQLR